MIKHLIKSGFKVASGVGVGEGFRLKELRLGME